jgi:type VI secretion system protein ImpK
MREEIAAVVHPVLSYGLQLRDRLLRGERPDLDREQRELIKLLRSNTEAQRWPDYGGAGERYAGSFWGSRYALACWLDEIFLNEDFRQTPWGVAWNDKKIEVQLYGSNDRAWMFWFQAELAEAVGADALEVFYLCVMLGFRGEGEKKPADLDAWRDQLEARLERSPEEQTGLKVELNARPRRGRERLRGVLLLVLGVLAILIPFASCYVVFNYLGG